MTSTEKEPRSTKSPLNICSRERTQGKKPTRTECLLGRHRNHFPHPPSFASLPLLVSWWALCSKDIVNPGQSAFQKGNRNNAKLEKGKRYNVAEADGLTH